jgi:hypothetical protein
VWNCKADSAELGRSRLILYGVLLLWCLLLLFWCGYWVALRNLPQNVGGGCHSLLQYISSNFTAGFISCLIGCSRIFSSHSAFRACTTGTFRGDARISIPSVLADSRSISGIFFASTQNRTSSA